MKWHLYNKDDPNTWPQVDCPIVVYKMSGGYPDVYQWDPVEHCFVNEKTYKCQECYYAYIGYVPSGYRTLYPTKCTKEKRCDEGHDDDGYCMTENPTCEFAKVIPEYVIEEKAIWKEF